MADPTNPPAPAKPTVTPTIGQPIWFYGDHEHARGMKSHDWDVPFAGIVTYVQNDRRANILVADHNGTTFALNAVPVFQGDDEDDKTALCHCELEAPKPKEVVAVSGAEGEPIALNLAPKSDAEDDAVPLPAPASMALTFTVPTGATYTFISAKAAINQAFAASGKPQTLAVTTAQIEAGALSDLSITVNNDPEVTLAVAVVDQAPTGALGKKHTFTEAVTVSAAPPVAPPAANPAVKPVVPAPPVPLASPVMGSPPLPPFVPPPASPAAPAV